MSDEKHTLTAKEVIEILHKVPPETEVWHYDDVYAYQPIQDWSYPLKDIVKGDGGRIAWVDTNRILFS